jgi:hypothetical protein
MAHMATTELQHTPEFRDLLSLICLAAFENGFIQLQKMPCAMFTTNGQPIISKQLMINEIIEGIALLSPRFPELKIYFEEMVKYLNRQ